MDGQTKKLKAALIGCGGMGTTHNLALKALEEKENVEVTALADCRPEFLSKASAIWPNAALYHTGMELLEAEQPDLVHICLPSYLHAEHAIAAMRKEISVFCEKPVCLTEEEADELLEVQQETGTAFMVGQVVRFFPEYAWLKEIYDKRTYGNLRTIVMQRLSGKVTWGFENWFLDEKKCGSVILDLHIHDLDFLRYLLGEPDSFQVQTAEYDSGMINQVLASYRFGEVKATAEGLWDISPALPFCASFHACFDEATVVYNGSAAPAVTVYTSDGQILHPEIPVELDMHDTSAGINISDIGPYYSEIKYFLECIRYGKENEKAPLIEGVRSARLAIKELEAARVGGI